MGESRQELLNWLNSLLQLNVTRVEQLGTGAALTQVFDSIYGDVPMHKVKFNVNTEYAYLNNFKVLQNVFTKHRIDHPLPVVRLVKCKFQDNLEILQWAKLYWDQFFPGGEYDAIGRRKGQAPVAPGPTIRAASAATAKRDRNPTVRGVAKTPLGGGARASILENENDKLRLEDSENKKNFYYQQLLDIETLLNMEVESHPELEDDSGGLVQSIRNILYKSPDGFNVEEEEEEGEVF